MIDRIDHKSRPTLSTPQRTVLEENELDPSRDSPKPHGGYVLSGDRHANQFTHIGEIQGSFQNLHYDDYTRTDFAPAKQSSFRVEAPTKERTQPRKTITSELKPLASRVRDTITQPQTPRSSTSTRVRDTITQPQTPRSSTSTRVRDTITQPQTPRSSTSTRVRDTITPAAPWSRVRDTTSEPARAVKTRLIPKTRAYCVKTLLDQSSNKDELLEIVRSQFPDLRKFMKKRFPGDSFGLALQKVNFDQVHETFKNVSRMRKLISLGGSICALFIGEIRQGSGFVLVGDLILTNAHLLLEALSEDGRTLIEPVRAVFNYEEKPVRDDAVLIFETFTEVIDLDWEMDYAVLYLNNSENKEVPPGLLPYFAPKPHDGGACVIGHPGNNVKKIDFMFIIGKNERENAGNQHLEPYDPDTRMVIVNNLKDKGIRKIWCSDLVITYNTSNMFHGSSGSPLFDGKCSVVGLHSAGFCYDYEGHQHCFIVYAHPALDIFSRFVSHVGSRGGVDLLADIKRRTNHNPHVMQVFQSHGV
ncbi:serine protease FAM111A-like [Eucyclogobius newberryi]|uniref:serine protease FAM111A-like n=1 Tax=Eucyclogobius newberryi TaxID=166745 RepID=UPI003B5B54EA